jgi:hypothetical protein
MRKAVAVKSDFLVASCLYVVPDLRRTNHSGQKNHVNRSITIGQLLEAEQRAAEWIRKKMRKIPPSSIEDPPEHRPTREKDASTA